MKASSAKKATLGAAPPAAARVRRSQAARSAEARAALLDAAITAVHQKGFAGATTAEIADRAGVSRALITHHFGSRAQLMAEVISTVYDREHREYLRIEATEHRGARLSDWPELLWEVLSKPSGIAVLEILQATRNDPELAALVAPMQERIEARTLESLHLRFGAVDTAHTLAVSRLLIWAIRGLAIAQVLVTDRQEIMRSVAFLRQLIEGAAAAGMLDDRERAPTSADIVA